MAILDKKNIRRKMLIERREMSSAEVSDLSSVIINKLKKLPIYKASRSVMLYLSFENEIDSAEIVKDCFKDGKRVIVPFCDNSDMSITPTEIKDRNTDLHISKMGYAQPKRELLNPVDVSDIDLIILPGIAFDRKGYRVGFGAGYYDRFLGQVNFSIPTIGLAYDFQIIDSFIEVEAYDIPIDYVMTEERIIVRTE